MADLPSPPFLYKYGSINHQNTEWVKTIFTRSEIYFSSPREFNDPFDCRHGFSFEGGRHKQDEYLKKLYSERDFGLSRHERRRLKREIRGIFKCNALNFLKDVEHRNEKILDNLGVFCLSENNDDILMWSHYSNSHRGYCLQFANSDFEPFFGRAQRVLYSEHYPIVNPVKQNYLERMNSSVLTKSDKWSYEKEWRIIDHENGPGVQRFPQDLLSGVILGCNISEKDEACILEWIQMRELRPKLYRCKMSNTSYKVHIEILE